MSKEEMLAYVEKAFVGKAPETIPAFLREFTTQALTIMDADKDGTVSKAAFTRHVLTSFPGEDPAHEFTRLDRGGDGSITADDLHTAAFAFFTDPPPDCPARWLRAGVSV
ncbi:hypothetical protein ACIO53_05580 [Streptomyces sp. NPDC087305]|uniref:hypothetical protein n=1 Tax=Streptomyces sp. NPDC087305 TaxID=3365781 RepID=UPI0037FE6437